MRKRTLYHVLFKCGGFFFLAALGLAYYVGVAITPTWTAEQISLDVHREPTGILYFVEQGKRRYLPPTLVPYEQAELSREGLKEINSLGKAPTVQEEYVFTPGNPPNYFLLRAHRHWQYWSLLPAFVALVLCWITREPVSSLFGGIVVGALIMGKYNLTGSVLVAELATPGAASIILLYLWLLGGLMGLWGKTGASQAFAQVMTKYFVRGPKSAKLVAWFLGVIFFQGGTISTVLVGTTVKPIADKNRVSHEELAYVVDSTASPIASQLAFNAWPGYVQTFIFVAGVPWLATEADRITFFFKSVPFCYYAIFAVLGTFLLSIEKAPFLGKKMRRAMERSRRNGNLDAPGAEPMYMNEFQENLTPSGYHPHWLEFVLPLLLLIGIAIGTFVAFGTPNVQWAFGAALVLTFCTAIIKGMSLRDALDGFANGLKGVVLGCVVLLLAIMIGSISKQTGGGLYLVELLRNTIPFWALPVLLQVITVIIAFSTGTSWGTYAITFPLAMPLAWSVANEAGLAHPEFFMTICFAAVMDGSVFGDQCSPISDTTVLSSMCTGCDLMDHVKTQIPQASVAALIAAVGWTLTVWFFA